MPRYDFRCSEGHVTEQRAGIETETIPCPCGRVADRLAVYRFNVAGDVAVPDSEGFYKNEAGQRALRRQGWDGARAIEHLRQSRIETEAGYAIDMKKANAPVVDRKVY